MIGEHLNPDGASLVDVFLPRPTPEQSENAWEYIKTRIMEQYYPMLVGHLEGLQVAKIAHGCKTIEELEQLPPFNQVPPDMFRKLIDILNAMEDLTDDERTYALYRSGDSFVFSATQYVEKILHQRAAVIAKQPKSRIIT